MRRANAMNLQINLILDSEVRSGSKISLKFAARIAGVSIPVLLGLVIAGLVLAGRSAKQNLLFAEQEKSRTEPVYRLVIKMNQELKESQQVADVVEGWAASRTDWNLLLRRLQAAVPPSIQLLRMNMDETVGPADNAACRLAGMSIKGQAIGESAEADVRALDQALKTGAAFTNAFANVKVQRFEASENAAEKNTRVFDIECILAPKKICKP